LESLDGQAVGYTGKTFSEIQDPLTDDTDRKLKLTALLSIIDMDETGAILIRDGHGSEIRMHRGNITISCPGDIRTLPGRDNITMTPRNHVINAGADLELASSDGDVRVKSEYNTRLLSGNGGTGYTVIENRSTAAFDADPARNDYDSNEFAGGGLILKSESDAALLGRNIRLGLHDPSDRSEEGLSPSNKTGNILIDGGLGSLTLQAAYLYGTGSALVSLASYGAANGSILNLYPSGQLTAVATSMGFGTNAFRVGAIQDPVSGIKLGKDGVSRTEVAVGQGQVNCEIAGSMKLDGGLSMEQTLACSTVLSQNVITNSAVVNNAGELSGMKPSKPVNIDSQLDRMRGDAIEPIDVSGANTTFDSLADRLSTMMGTASLFTGYGAFAVGFAYPGSDYYQTTSHYIVQASWQTMLNSDIFWKENPVLNPVKDEETYVYPGKESWTNSSYVRKLKVEGSGRTLTVSPENSGSLKDAYKVNKP
jgi:hypothetical protein